LAVFQGFRACFSSCSAAREEKKIEKIEANITDSKAETNVLANQKEVISNEVNQANANFADVQHRDSSTRSTDFGAVRRKFCQQNIPATVNASEDDLKECTQMLDQTLDELKALKAYAASLEKKSSIDEAIEKKQAETIASQGKLIAIYEKKRGTTISFFFGLVKIKKN
jgi:chromosome segregation ATPase